MNVAQWLSTYGYGVVLLSIMIESTGIPFPGKTILLIAAVAAGTTHQLAIPLVIVAAVSGAILASASLYSSSYEHINTAWKRRPNESCLVPWMIIERRSGLRGRLVLLSLSTRLGAQWPIPPNCVLRLIAGLF